MLVCARYHMIAWFENINIWGASFHSYHIQILSWHYGTIPKRYLYKKVLQAPSIILAINFILVSILGLDRCQFSYRYPIPILFHCPDTDTDTTWYRSVVLQLQSSVLNESIYSWAEQNMLVQVYSIKEQSKHSAM